MTELESVLAFVFLMLVLYSVIAWVRDIVASRIERMEDDSTFDDWKR